MGQCPVLSLDGHPGIWKLFCDIATSDQRLEILDWYHLKENLFKVGGSLNRILKTEAVLWHGNLDAVLDLLKSHASRIVNYADFQSMVLVPIPIGSGSVESDVKQID